MRSASSGLSCARSGSATCCTAVTTTAPLLQRWFVSTRHREAADPYFLYAASNLGSLLALLAYPFLLERLLPLSGQSRAWTFLYGLGALLIVTSALVLCTRLPGMRVPREAVPCLARTAPFLRPSSICRRCLGR